MTIVPIFNGASVKKLSKSSSKICIVNSPTDHLRCVFYAMRTIVRVLPALGSDKDHLHPPSGLSFKHFAIAGVMCAVLLVGSLIVVVMLVLGGVTAK